MLYFNNATRPSTSNIKEIAQRAGLTDKYEYFR